MSFSNLDDDLLVRLERANVEMRQRLEVTERTLRFGVGFEADGTTRMELHGSQEKGRTTFRIMPNGTSYFNILTNPNTSSLELRVVRDGTSDLTFYRAGTRVLGLGIGDEGTTGISCFDRAGKPRLNVGVRPNGRPTFQMLDEDGNVKVEASDQAQ